MERKRGDTLPMSHLPPSGNFSTSHGYQPPRRVRDVKDFAVVVFIGLTLVPLYAAWTGKMNGLVAGGLIVALAIAAVILQNADTFTSFVAEWRDLKIRLERIQREVFAKVETVRRIGEETAELATFTALSVGRYAADDLQAQLLASRDRIVSIMKEIGVDETKIKATAERFNQRVADDLRKAVTSAVERATHSIREQALASHQEPPFDRNAVYAEVVRRLSTYSGSEQDRAAFLAYLQGLWVETAAAAPTLDILDRFLNTGRLKP